MFSLAEVWLLLQLIRLWMALVAVDQVAKRPFATIARMTGLGRVAEQRNSDQLPCPSSFDIIHQQSACQPLLTLEWKRDSVDY